MKIAYKHLVKRIESKPSIEDISEKLLQLGHEHEINQNIFDMEFTPNRGDCLSINGLLRDLSVFYNVHLDTETYDGIIEDFNIGFSNNTPNKCPALSFLKIDLENIETRSYKDELKNYYRDLDIKKNNFFTDVSNYISYETGQPTHCYDASKIKGDLSLDVIKGKFDFETLLDKTIKLTGENLVFLCNDQIINLAGVIGGKNTSCSKNTSSVIVECANFDPEAIIGKSIKYNINSDAAYKFERSTDPECHEFVIRRFINIVLKHANVQNIQLYSYKSSKFKHKLIPYERHSINKINGIEITNEEYQEYLSKLGFSVANNEIRVPSHRNDILTQNDLAEEIARVIGYDNIPSIEFKIINSLDKKKPKLEYKLKRLLIDNGFFEVINAPFVEDNYKDAIKIDNPLDLNKNFLRKDLRKSLLENLLYNERRQKDSIKLFEISDVYSNLKSINKKRVIGIIVSGIVGKNFKDFSKKLDDSFISSVLSKFIERKKIKFFDIPRDSINSKLKTKITFAEIELNEIDSSIVNYEEIVKPPKTFKKYKSVSEFPASSRDLSFSIEDYAQSKVLEDLILNYKNNLLKECFVFDYYKNEKLKVIKVGYRFIFQSQNKTITDEEVDKLINDIILKSLEINSVTLPGYYIEH